MRIQSPRGTEDVLPIAAPAWREVESAFWRTARSYGYGEIRTPIFEDTALFLRTSGETSDVVSKEMYTFVDKGDRSVTLKPELTAPTMRAVVEHSLVPPGTVGRFAYVGPIFRYGRPQTGRLRQAHQFGIELVGAATVEGEIETIAFLDDALKACGLSRYEIRVNSLGGLECRERFRTRLLDHLAPWLRDQDEEGRAKALKNPLRLLDTKDPVLLEALRGLAPITDDLEPESRRRLDAILDRSQREGRRVVSDPGIVRGLDYYTETVLEVIHDDFGPSLAGGGRYDGLVKSIGGAETPAVGFGAGIERILLCREKENVVPPVDSPDAFAIAVDEASTIVAADLARRLRGLGAAVLRDPNGASLKSQLRQADRSGARFALVVGESERERGVFQAKDLRGGGQADIPLADAEEWWRAGSV